MNGADSWLGTQQRWRRNAPKALSKSQGNGALVRQAGGPSETADTRFPARPGRIPTRLIGRVVQELGDDDATHMAAGVSYYAVLSLFPLALGLSAILGMVAASPHRQEEVIEFIVGYIPGSESFVRDSVASAVNFRTTLGILSALSLLWMGSAIFGAITLAVNRAWGVPRNPPFYQNKPRQLALAVAVAILFMFSVSITGFLQWATSIDIAGNNLESLLGGGIIAGILKIPALLVSFAIFIAIYKVLPNTRTHWRYIWLGALVAADALRGRQISILVVPGQLCPLRPGVRQHCLGDRSYDMGLFLCLCSNIGGRSRFRIRPATAGG